MVYNDYGHGQNNSPYYSMQNHQSSVSSVPSNESSYRGQQNVYLPYYQTPTSYAQSSDRQYQTKSASGTDASSNYDQTQYRSHQYQQRSDTDTYNYNTQQQQHNQYSIPPPSEYSASGSKRGGYDENSRTNEARSYADTSALGSLAYVSALSGNAINSTVEQSTASSAQPSYTTTASVHEYRRPSPLSHEQLNASYSPYAPSQSPSKDRQLSNPTQHSVNYPSHVGANSDKSTKRVSSPAQKPAKPASITQSRAVNSPKQPSMQYPGINRSNASNTRTNQNTRSPVTSTVSTQAPSTSTLYDLVDTHMDYSRDDSSFHGRSDSTQSQNIAQSIEQPTTVNPTQIFSPPEPAPRKTMAMATEAKTNKQASNTPQSSAAQMKASADSQSRDQIQAEMKAMIEKMREYKAQDPSGFTEIWEQLKKVQPPPPRASSQAPAGSKSNPAPINVPARDTVISPVLTGGAFSPPPPESAFATSEKAMPDVGKFPANRRKRKSDKPRSEKKERKSTGEASTKGTPSTKATSAAQAGAPTPTSSSFATPNPVDNMRQAIYSFYGVSTPSQSPLSVQVSRPGKTVWPPHKRAVIGQSMQSYLEALPENKGKQISMLEILTMLAEDPSYDALCLMLSSKGFGFDRGVLARTLLSKTEIESAVSLTSPAVALSVEDTIGQAFNPTFISHTPVVAQARSTPIAERSTTQLPPYSPSFQTPMSAPVRKTSSTPAPAPNSVPHARPTPAPKPAAPLTKQEMARKRNFSDIIDLTALDEDEKELEEEEPQPKRIQSREASLAVLPSTPLASTSMGAVGTYSTPYSSAPKKSLHTIEFSAPNSSKVTPGRDLRRMQVVKPLIKRVKMMPLNVSTVARDFLIAIGKHPGERPLNYHLKDLAKNFEHVNRNSDLSTFRWDLVDPGGPAVPKPSVIENVKEEAIPAATSSNFIDQRDAEGQQIPRFQSIMTRGRGRGPGRPRGRPSVRGGVSRPMPDAAQGSPAEGRSLVSGGQGRGGLGRGGASPHHPITSSHPMPKPNPGIPAQAGSRSTETSVFSKNFSSNVSNTGGPNETTVISSKPVTAAPKPVPKPAPVNAVDLSTGATEPTPLTTKGRPMKAGAIWPSGKRRGRPPGVRNKVSSIRDTTPKVGGIERAILSGADQSPTTEIEQSDGPADIPGLPKKRRGRPPGSKNLPKPGPKRPNTTVPADGIGIMIRSRSSSQANRTPVSYVEPLSKTPQTWSAVNTQPDSSPSTKIFKTFSCGWSGCTANLHNLDVLRKHVLKFHGFVSGEGQPGARGRCLWTGCDFNGTFAMGSSLREHIEETHLKKLAWRMGDGPATHPEGKT